MNMIDRKLLAAGYAAAVGSIILVIVLLSIAVLSDLGAAEGNRGPAAAQSTSEGNNSKETGAEDPAEEGLSGEDRPGVDPADADFANDDPAEEEPADGEEAESAGEAWVEEQADYLATVMDQTNSAAEIMTLSGKELWSRFDGAVLTGDSRVVGFSLYTGIPGSHVKARNGATITELPGFVQEIAALRPQRVFIAYGINDIKSSVGGKTAAGYAEYAAERIAELEEALDGADIFVNSILPVSPSLAQRDPDYQKVGAYNRELKEMCRKHGWHYIDNDRLAADHADLYVSDGIHLEAGFYEHWGRNMLIFQAGVHNDEGGTGVDR